MALTDEEKSLITTSFTQIAPIAEEAAAMFYARLFEIDPTTKPLFKETDMREQGRKLMQTLGTAVGAIHRLESIIPDLEALGKRHLAYGVSQEQYASVGQALIWTLGQGLGETFTPEVETAWTKVYTLLADVATRIYQTKDTKN